MPQHPPAEPELTTAALRAMELAGDEARALYHSFLGTEHLVIGVARQAEEDGRHTALDPAPHLLRREAVRIIPPGRDPLEQPPIPTRRVRAVLRTARAEATRCGHPHVGVHHLVLGLTSVGGGVAHEMLRRLDVDATGVRERAFLLLTEDRAA
ncbi:Clp protease N-terminal domain-containing protein [Nocardiopsis sp. MG754419]|uniref:Clp protease N-terminal domain-containing protein n=1 Tax=Nocardiopsis sp. MG754419 TaxID=2259865 RepID=UPI001BA904A9|nr:Clp protease N-terminal domain-containing protein [Nocardiopsis sp. MG754419]